MTAIRRFIFCVTAAMSFALTSPSFADQGPTVDAPAGVMEGQAEGALHVFKGIPYAQPPVGQLRWRAPILEPHWQGVKKTVEFGPECVQPKSTTLSSVYSAAPQPMSEDCLTLNIWTPANAHNAPVFFWIYGGALWGGASRDPLYDGTRMAKAGVIVVTINYRLGVLGWLAHPGLSAESPYGISGNYGMLDQIAALHWVKLNIGAFGGDASNVTIAGESAGGLSVMYLMASPYAHGLFSKAIAESAYMISTPVLKSAKYGVPSAEAIGSYLGAALHAPDIASLRAIDTDTLTATAAKAGFAPFAAVDGKILPGQLVDIFDKGEQAHVPILAGFNSGEIRSLRVLAPPPPATSADYEKTIREKYLDLSDAFLKLYPSTNMQESVLATTRDALYGWTAERLAMKQTAAGQPAYLYLFDHGYPAENTADLHGFHASELPYVFGTPGNTPPLWPKIPATDTETKLSDAMIGYWTSFASNGRPTAANEPDWPVFGSGQAYMDITDSPHLSDHVFPGMYPLHEQAVCRRKAADLAWNWNVGVLSPVLTKADCP